VIPGQLKRMGTAHSDLHSRLGSVWKVRRCGQVRMAAWHRCDAGSEHLGNGRRGAPPEGPNEKQKSSAVPPLSEPESRALEAYDAAYELESTAASSRALKQRPKLPDALDVFQIEGCLGELRGGRSAEDGNH
jgi:hypothetical protein